MSKENKTVSEEIETVAPEVVELEWEEVEEILGIREAMLDSEEQLSRWLLEVEKQKAKSLNRINQLEKALYAAGTNLRDSKGVTSEATYELKLPTSPGEKGYFIRKDS